MKILVNKIIFGVLFCFISWKGLDGLFVNYYSRHLFDIDIDELDLNECKRNRYFKINNGIAYGNYIYYEENPNSKLDIIYPLLSAKEIYDLQHGKNVEAKVLIRRNKLVRECLTYGSCFFEDSLSITGLSRIGFDKLSRDEYNMLEDGQLKISKDAILLEAEAQQIAIHWNLLMFFGGTIFAFTLLKSFFRKAESIQDYWNKVSEKTGG